MIPVGVIGATGIVGQKFITLLNTHPYFQIVLVAASQSKVGKRYDDVCQWALGDATCPQIVKDMILVDAQDADNICKQCRIVFSALPTESAYSIEAKLATTGIAVFTNASAYRRDPEIPILIGPLNIEPWALAVRSRFFKHARGMILTGANCSTSGLALALCPLRPFGIQSALVTTMQSASGAGLPGPTWHELNNNVIPYIPAEAEKIQWELHKIFAKQAWSNSDVYLNEENFPISVQCNRVPVHCGHMLSVAVQLADPPRTAGGELDLKRIEEAFENFDTQYIRTPSQPKKWITVDRAKNSPQPKIHCNIGEGMAIVIGQITKCPVLGLRFVCLVNNLALGAAGTSILNAEVAVEQMGLLKLQQGGGRYSLYSV